MRRDSVIQHSLAIGDASMIAYGHYGRPVLAFPSDAGRAYDWENLGMLEGLRDELEGGRLKLYCVDSYDAGSWRNGSLSLEGRAQAHQRYEDYIVNDVVPAIYDDCQGTPDILVTGVSFGAFHAANFALRRGDLFPVALCMSGVYDMSGIAPGSARGDAFYFTNPMDYVANFGGDHLDWIRSRVFVQLVCGQGAWENESASGALPSTLRFAEVLASKGVPHDLDLWGHDVAHDWPSWRAQVAYHLPRFL